MLGSVFRTRLERKELSGVDAGVLTQYVLDSRAEGTMRTYAVALKKTWEYGVNLKRSLFLWGEGEVCSLLMHLVKQGATESTMKQCLAIVSMVFEAMGRSSPTKSLLVTQVKKAAVKKRVMGAQRSRVVMLVKHLEVLVMQLYKKPAGLVGLADMRCLVLQVLLFLGMKRFSDIQNIRVNDVHFREDGVVEIKLRKTKTDQEARGSTFVVVGDRKRGLLVTELLGWYFKKLGLTGQDFVFCSLRGTFKGGVRPVKNVPVSYGAALKDLKVICGKFSLPALTLHSARIGAATAGAEAGVSREFLQACGGWSSSAVDGYVRLKDSGVVFNRAIFRQV